MSFFWTILLIGFIVYMIYFDRKIKKTETYKEAITKGTKPPKKLLRKRWWSWVLIVFLLIADFTALSIEADNHDKTYKAEHPQTSKKKTVAKKQSKKKKETAKPKTNQEAKATKEKSPQKSEPKKASVPREYKNALLTLMDYQNSEGDMSYKGLYEQLTSDAGEGFTPDAAKYALSHAKIDYNENALKCAKNYEKTEHMSTAELQDQLTSDSGESFTPEQAQYAIQHLEK
ncbi:Ltp family lipoprotein [Lactobacillus bombicola]|uniref:Superinfection immunity protein n=1 Tax=Lactobacillus bombicola TaxID=1505723 RepID=A0ABX9LWS8_9LACO|nr:Ltp family lipoprotein [Lactobacillus bombicola]RHW48873.1 superinfection immunity protein [Lactobacillus bombicola]RHW53595.1 superinfection immunity protein [Lactobacillus bombicola]